MRYRVLGRTGIEVSVHCLGTMMFGAVGNSDHDDCVRIIHAALDQGINFVDTADMYSAGESEEIVGKALQCRRDDVVLATKVHFPMGEGRNRGGNSRRWIVREVEESLRRLNTDWIDLYQVHRPDSTTDIEETLSVLTDLVRQGKIRAFGCSTFPAEQIVEAHHVAERRGLHRFRTEQPPYSLLARGIETDLLPVTQRYGMGVLTWSPLASGFLTGRYRKGQPVDLSTGRAALTPVRFDPAIEENVRKLDVVEKLVELASEIGCTLPAGPDRRDRSAGHQPVPGRRHLAPTGADRPDTSPSPDRRPRSRLTARPIRTGAEGLGYPRHPCRGCPSRL
ncbi:aldo/keto reductase [Micromonospora sonchi]|uniref:Aldo/keto reductase n=1 Tax=Micromonospora sonchi TaxID=1763543 RepID=A0A917U441_9ACTN|nr:aldo/keto reductase [Micromonospora sonchi]